VLKFSLSAHPRRPKSEGLLVPSAAERDVPPTQRNELPHRRHNFLRTRKNLNPMLKIKCRYQPGRRAKSPTCARRAFAILITDMGPSCVHAVMMHGVCKSSSFHLCHVRLLMETLKVTMLVTSTNRKFNMFSPDYWHFLCARLPEQEELTQ